jgi:uncharacterized membrane protein YciS (DUF1049 family)
MKVAIFFAVGFGLGWWLSSLAMQKRLRTLTGQLRAHSEPLAKAVKDNQPKISGQ